MNGDLAAKPTEQAEHGMDVAHLGHAFKNDRPLGHDRGGQDGKRGVLAAGGGHGAGQSPTSANLQGLRCRGRLR